MAPRRRPPALMDDVVREILLRLPPDEPAHLVRASLVCKPWRRLLADRGFLRLYRAFHGRTPPLLGFLHNLDSTRRVPRFLPASATAVCPFTLPEPDPHSWWVLDSRHGRVLVHSVEPRGLIVWDPITDDQKKLPLPVLPYRSFAAAVLCAEGGCDHLDCHGGPFLVVFTATGKDETWATIYSSKVGAWQAPTTRSSIRLGPASHVVTTPSLLAGGALYFTLRRGEHGIGILRYDWSALSVIDPPFLQHVVSMSLFPLPPYRLVRSMVLVTAEDGGLGVATVECLREAASSVQRHSLHLWAWRAGAAGSLGGWVRRRVIDLDELLPAATPKTCAFASKRVSGFAEGADTIFVSTNVGVFAVELESFRSMKLTKIGFSHVVPYVSFFTPDLTHFVEGGGQTSDEPSQGVPKPGKINKIKKNFVRSVKNLAASILMCAELKK